MKERKRERKKVGKKKERKKMIFYPSRAACFRRKPKVPNQKIREKIRFLVFLLSTFTKLTLTQVQLHLKNSFVVRPRRTSELNFQVKVFIFIFIVFVSFST